MLRTVGAIRDDPGALVMAAHKVISVSVFTFLLTVSAAMATDEHYKKGYTPTDNQASYIAMTQAYVKDRLRDPSGARFRHLYINRKNRLGYPVVCGEINTKNGSGDYSGWQRFAATPVGDHVSLEKVTKFQEFKKVWVRICQ